MIRKIRVYPWFVVFLSLSVNAMYAFPGRGGDDGVQVKVAFLGVYFEGLDQKIQEKILNDFLTMFQLEPSINLQTPTEIEGKLGRERVDLLLKNLSADSLLNIGTILGVDYIYAAKLANESKDSNQVILAGSFHRYDRLTGATYSYSILKFYQNFHEDLKIIKDQFVSTIKPRQESIFSKWPVFLLAGIVLVGLIILFLAPGKTAGEGTLPPEPTPT